MKLPKIGRSKVVPLTHLGDLDELPLELPNALPAVPMPVHVLGKLAAYVTQVAHECQVPVDSPGMLVLSMVLTTIAKRVGVCIDNWKEPACAFICVVMPPGSRKSAVVMRVAAPLREYERTEAARIAPARSAALSRRRIQEKRLALMEKVAAEGETAAERQAALNTVQEVQKEIAEHWGADRVMSVDQAKSRERPSLIGEERWLTGSAPGFGS
jgi:hypothetical protein